MPLAVLNRQLSILLLTLTGALGKRWGVMTEGFSDGLSRFLVNLILPCSIFSAFLSDVGAEVWQQSLQIVAIMVALHLFYMVVGLLFCRQRESRKAVLRFGILCPNTNFMGFPVISGIYGEVGTLLLFVALVPSRIFIWTVGVSYFTTGSPGERWKKLLKNPSMWAVALGLLLSAAKVRHLWPPLEEAIQLLAKCTTPLSMMMIGAVVSQLKLDLLRDRWVWLFCLLRLLACPLLVLAALRALGFSGALAGVCVMMSALPAGALTVAFTKEYRRDETFAAACVILSTILSVGTVPLVSLLCSCIR